MIRQTGGFSFGATSTRSSPAPRALSSASSVEMTPSCSPSSDTTLMGEIRIWSFTLVLVRSIGSFPSDMARGDGSPTRRRPIPKSSNFQLRSIGESWCESQLFWAKKNPIINTRCSHLGHLGRHRHRTSFLRFAPAPQPEVSQWPHRFSSIRGLPPTDHEPQLIGFRPLSAQ